MFIGWREQHIQCQCFFWSANMKFSFSEINQKPFCLSSAPNIRSRWIWLLNIQHHPMHSWFPISSQPAATSNLRHSKKILENMKRLYNCRICPQISRSCTTPPGCGTWNFQWIESKSEKIPFITACLQLHHCIQLTYNYNLRSRYTLGLPPSQ